jgi:hypothetical protein
MTDKKTKAVVAHNERYKAETVWRMTLVMLVTGAVAALLAISIVHILLKPVKTYYFKSSLQSDGNGAVVWRLDNFKQVAVSKPSMSDTHILQWTTDQLAKSFALNYSNTWLCDKNSSVLPAFPNLSLIMTKSGLTDYVNFLRPKQQSLDSQSYAEKLCGDTQSGVIYAQLNGAPTIESEMNSPDNHYYWYIDIPLRVTVNTLSSSSNNTVIRDPQSKNYEVKVRVRRVSNKQYTYGVAIDRIVMGSPS